MADYSFTQAESANLSRFLDSLPKPLQEALKPDLESVTFENGEVLFSAGQVTSFVYFPTTCLISMVVTLENGNTVEAAAAGSDGFVGIGAFLGLESVGLTAVVRIPGEALRMRVEAFRRHLADATLRDHLRHFTAYMIAVVVQNAACIAFHPLHERLARWLLVIRDATERNELPLTQEALAAMLGVHRPTVTIAVRQLESAGLIEHNRGRLRIIDVPALMAATCECYDVTSKKRRLVSSRPTSANASRDGTSPGPGGRAS